MDFKIISRNLFRLEDIIFISIVSFLFFFSPGLMTKGGDFGCILLSGENIVRNFSLISPKLIIFTEPNPFFCNATWLSDAIFFLLHNHIGLWAIVLFCAVITSGVFTFIYRKCSEVNSYWIINIGLLALGIIATSHFVEINSRIFSYLFFTIFYYFLKSREFVALRKSDYVIYLIIFVFWSNFNTDFFYGFLLIAIFVLSNLLNWLFLKDGADLNEAKKYINLLILCFIASFVNINVFSAHIMLVNFFSEGLTESFGYLASPNFHVKMPYLFFECIILIVIFLAGKALYRPKTNELLSIPIFLALSLYSAINIPFFVIIVLPIIAGIIGQSISSLSILKLEQALKIFNTQVKAYRPVIPIVFSLIIFLFYYLNIIPWSNLGLFKDYPQLSTKFIKEKKLSDKILNPLGWGCYISNELKCRVFTAENIYMQTQETLNDLSSITNIEKKYNKVLDKYGIKTIIFPSGSPLEVALSENPLWESVYKDAVAVIYKKKCSKVPSRN